MMIAINKDAYSNCLNNNDSVFDYIYCCISFH